MGKKSDELQREIADYRRQLDAKADRLNERVRNDMSDSRETVNRDVRERLQLEKYADERPLLTLAAAFGTGVVLGTVTPAMSMPSMPSMPGRSGTNGNGQRRESGGQSGSGMLSSLLGSASGALSGTIEDEVRQIFEQFAGRRERSSSTSQRRFDTDMDRHAERERTDSSDLSDDVGARRST